MCIIKVVLIHKLGWYEQEIACPINKQSINNTGTDLSHFHESDLSSDMCKK